MESGPAFLRRMVKSFYRAIVYTGGGREHDQILVRADDRVDCPQSDFFFEIRATFSLSANGKSFSWGDGFLPISIQLAIVVFNHSQKIVKLLLVQPEILVELIGMKRQFLNQVVKFTIFKKIIRVFSAESRVPMYASISSFFSVLCTSTEL